MSYFGLALRSVVAMVIVAVGLVGCTLGRDLVAPKADFISAHSAGVISVKSPVTIQFAVDVKSSLIGNERESISINPSIEGTFDWTDDRTVQLTPAQALRPNSRYTIHFNAKKLLGSVTTARDFDFVFRTMRQDIQVAKATILADDAGQFRISGTIGTNDAASNSDVEKVLGFGGLNPAKIQWEHDEAKHQHRFTTAPVDRSPRAQTITVRYNGLAIGADKNREESLVIPGADDFSFVASRAISADEEYVELTFSDPIDPKQDLAGLIRADRPAELRYSVRGNNVRVYNADTWPRTNELVIRQDLRSKAQKRLVADVKQTAVFPKKVPEVRFAGKGVIIPTSQGMNLPIETMNLNAVMVEATRIYQDNVTQFLQVNNLDGDRELYRVGTVVWRDVIKLPWTADKADKWQRVGLDLTPLMAKYPDGMFRIRLTFRHQHIEYQATSGANQDTKSVKWDATKPNDGQDSSFWDSIESSLGGEDAEYDDENNDYNQRHNPENPAFYKKFYDHDIAQARNVLISDIGLLGRKSSSGAFEVVVTNLKEATAWQGIPVTVLNYQRQKIAEGVSDGRGFIRFDNLKDKPYFLVAKQANQWGWLRMAEGENLIISQFDVAGETVEKGLNAFFYGERGVWRPGDAIHLTLVVNDPNKTLPANHPVRLTLIDPEGKTRRTMVKTDGLNGFYYFALATDANDPTGYWEAQARVGSSTFTKSLKIETVVPNRLKIDMQIKDAAQGVRKTLEGTVSSAWLTGAIAGGLNVKIKGKLDQSTTTFGGDLAGYNFDDASRGFKSDPVDLFDGKLDASGKTNFKYDGFKLGDGAPGKLKLNLETKVFEPSGAFSTDNFAVDYHFYKQYVGLKLPRGDAARNMLLTDTDHQVQVALVDTNGQPIRSGKVKLAVYKAQWRWWWQTGGDDPDADYQSSEDHPLIAQDSATAINGRATLKFRVAYPEWGRYLIKVTDVDGGHTASSYAYIDWPGWAGRSTQDGPGGAAVLSLTTDKKKYTVGEPVTLSIPGNKNARALVSFEAGGSVYKSEWVQLTGETTAWTFRASEEMAPNIYAHVTLLQPHLQTVNDLPIRLYGVVPIVVEDPKTHIKPVIASDDTFKPEQVVRVRVRETTGRPMTYTLAIVDEGLLSLTRFAAPDPWNQFYKRQASLVKTWDLFNFVSGALAGKLETLLAIGGGEDSENNGRKKNNRFPPVVLYEAPRNLAAGGENVHELKLPPYVGAVRIMVIGGQSGAFGTAEKSVTVKQDLMLLGTLPRVLGPSEKAAVPVTVFYGGAAPQTVNVKIQSVGVMSVEGPAEQNVRFDAPGEKTIRFNVASYDRAGTATIQLTASDPAGHNAAQKIVMDVRQSAQAQTQSYAATIKPGSSWENVNLKLFGMPGTSRVFLELSILPPLDLQKRLAYLIHYPHGCIEQTTSAIFPQLFLGDLIDLTSERKAQIQANIDAGIKRLQSFQLASGGFAYWPGGTEADVWGTDYAGHFLLEARRAGYEVPASMLGSWLAFQKKSANEWTPTSTDSWSNLGQAYRLYTLALAGQPDVGAMNRLSERVMPSQARWRLAAAYKLAGLDQQARVQVSKADSKIVPYRELSNSYGSDLRDEAMILETMLLLDMTNEVDTIAKVVSDQLSSAAWLSTQETAYSLIAMSRLAKLGTGKGLQVQATWNGQPTGAIATTKAVFQRELPVGQGDGRIKLDNTGSSLVFARVLVQGVPPLGTETEVSNGLKMSIRYLGSDAKPVLLPKRPNATPGPDANLKSATEMQVEVTVINTSRASEYKQLSLSELFPSGFEITNPKLSGAGALTNSPADYVDFRDDRVQTYFGLKPGEAKTYRVLVTAAYDGRFYLPAIRAEAMYDASIAAQIPGQWITIGSDKP